jgi:lipopolysaccharide export system protein LptA
MESDTNFQGERLPRPVPLTVHWSKSMVFNGGSAVFEGNIQAVQEKARLACQDLQVYFDRTISLKQGNKTDEPARVRHLVCSKDVRIEDHVYQGDKLVKYQRINSPAVMMRALEPDEDTPRGSTSGQAKAPAHSGNQVEASGPGDVRILEHSEDPIGAPVPGRSTAAKPTAPPGGKAPAEMKMTYVAFENRMDANSKKNTAHFWGKVRVLNFPCNRHDVVIDLDAILLNDLPEKAVYMACDQLKVLDSKVGGKPNKEMWATGRVYVQGREFYAHADLVTYNQAKEQVIFHGKDGGLATLCKVEARGKEPDRIAAKKIIYNRSTGKAVADRATSASGN